MQIPVGLMSPTALRNQRTYGNENQGYWEGDRYIAPKYKPKPPPSLMSPDVAAAVQMIDDSAKQAQQSAAQIPSMWGDGPQGEGFGGGRGSVAPGQSPGMNEAGHVNAPDVNANVSGMMGQPNPAGLPSLPDFKENTTPAAQTTPTNQDLAVSEVDPQGPSGATSTGTGKSGVSNSSAAAQAAAAQAAAQGLAAAVDKGIAADQAATGKGIGTATGMTDAVAAGMADTAPGVGNVSGVNANDQDETGGKTDPIGQGLNKGADMIGSVTKGVQSQVDAIAGMLGSVFGGLGTTSSGNSTGGLGGADGVGGPGAGGMGSPGGMGGGGSGAPGGSSDAGPGSWRKGGRTGNDGDKRKMEPRGIAHEDEFYLNPEMTSLMDRKAPGLLDALDRMQKGLMDRPRKPSRGLMGR